METPGLGLVEVQRVTKTEHHPAPRNPALSARLLSSRVPMSVGVIVRSHGRRDCGREVFLRDGATGGIAAPGDHKQIVNSPVWSA